MAKTARIRVGVERQGGTQKIHLKQNGYLKKNINMTSVTNMSAPCCFKIHCSDKNSTNKFV